MTLPSPRLDDLTWEDLRLLAQRRIPAASRGRWTHHDPVDPGVTLLELFAFLLEQQVYVLDQVPPPLLLAILALLDEAPLSAQVARTVLSFSPSTPPPAGTEPPSVPASTIVRPAHPELASRWFTTQHVVTPLRAEGGASRRVTLMVDGVSRDAELAHGKPVALSTGELLPLRVELVVPLQEPLPPANSQARVTFYIELARAGGVPAQWDARAVDVMPAVDLEFAYVDAAGVAYPVVAEDGTAGLRRSGLVSLPWPANLVGEQAVRLRISSPRAAFSAPPFLRSVTVNAAIAHHRSPVRICRSLTGAPPPPAGSHAEPGISAYPGVAEQIANWLPLSGLELRLPREVGMPLAETLELDLPDAGGQSHVWRRVLDFAFSAPNSEVFTFDAERRRLRFGDGYTGRVPRGSKDFELTMEVGGGSDGNLGAGLDWVIDPGETGAAPMEITNYIAARGGRGPETLDEARARVGASLAQRQRAVTRADFITLVETTPGIERHRANVAVGHHPGFPCAYVADAVTVFVVPRIDRSDLQQDPEAEIVVRAPVSDRGALSAIVTRLDAARLITTQVFVRVPVYRPVNLVVRVSGDSRNPTALAAKIRRALARHLDAVIGGNEHGGWPFGHPLRPSELLRVAQDAIGDDALVMSVGVTLDGDGDQESCRDKAIGPHQLVYLDSCRVTFERAASPGGVL